MVIVVVLPAATFCAVAWRSSAWIVPIATRVLSPAGSSKRKSWVELGASSAVWPVATTSASLALVWSSVTCSMPVGFERVKPHFPPSLVTLKVDFQRGTALPLASSWGAPLVSRLGIAAIAALNCAATESSVGGCAPCDRSTVTVCAATPGLLSVIANCSVPVRPGIASLRALTRGLPSVS